MSASFWWTARLSKESERGSEEYFLQHIFPVLTPLAIESGTSVPVHSQSRFLHRVATRPLTRRQADECADPRSPEGRALHSHAGDAGEGGAVRMIMLEQVTGLFIPNLFPGYKVKGRARSA